MTIELTENFLAEADEEKTDQHLESEDLEDDLIERTKIAMVLGAFESELPKLYYIKLIR